MRRPTDHGVPIADAARELGRHPATVRRWVAAGAPCVSLGSVGRGHGSRVRIEDLQRWRAGDVPRRNDKELLNLLAVSFWNVLRRDGVADRAGISEHAAAAVLLMAFERAHLDIMREPLGDLAALPAEMKQLCAIFVG